MSVPFSMPLESIPFDSIDLGVRARSNYDGIEDLAEDIADVGLIQPLILTEKSESLIAEYEAEFQVTLDAGKPYLLTAGGRRYWALATNEAITLYHASTSDPLRPGYLLQYEQNLLAQLCLESKENLRRHDIDWRDQLKLMVRTWRLARRQAHEKGERLTCRDFGITLGVSYQDLSAGDRIYDHFLAHPEEYAQINSITGALSVALRAEANELTRVAVARSLSREAVSPGTPTPELVKPVRQGRRNLVYGVEIALAPNEENPLLEQTLKDHVIPLTSNFQNTNGLDFLEAQDPGFCDHIVCDPDYAVDLAVIDSNPNNRQGIMAEGIDQKSVDQSLRDLFHFLPLAFRAITEHGFLIFWYSIDHHEKLQRAATAAGFRVQPWPLIWNKMDFRGRSNAAPNHNFPKSVEYAMVCRKPGTVLAKVQTSCVYTTTGNAVTKELNHPFAKPYEIWRWIYAAIALPGQVVMDPFVGSGSSVIAATSRDLVPLGTEIDPTIYNTLLANLQNHYRKTLGPDVKFS